MVGQIFHVILYQPLFNLFIFLYNIIPGHDLGLVIVAVTILVRLALYPLTSSGIKAQRALQDLQPKLAAIKKQYATDTQAQAQATLEMYKNNKVSPFSSCLPLLLQLPILIALYQVLANGIVSTDLSAIVYPFIHNPGTLNPLSFGLVNLAKPQIILAVLAGAAQYFQAKTLIRKSPPATAGMAGKDENMMAMMNKQMLYFMPVLTVIIGARLPAGLTLYWFFSTALMVLQQHLLGLDSKTSGTTTPPNGVIEGTIVK